MRLPHRIAATAAVVALCATGLAAGSVHAQEEPELGARLERACLRIPNLQIRTDNALARIQGDADTVGSLLWLDAQIERARERERDQLVEVLTNRRAVRNASIEVLELRAGSLDDLETLCIGAGVDL